LALGSWFLGFLLRGLMHSCRRKGALSGLKIRPENEDRHGSRFARS
jgi:hypothetical protein